MNPYRWTFGEYWIEHFSAFPPKVVMAKLRSMIRRGLMDGCACGCRGDFRPKEPVKPHPATVLGVPDEIRVAAKSGEPITITAVFHT